MRLTAPAPCPEGLKTLACEVARALGLPEADLGHRLAYLIEASPDTWAQDFKRDPRLATEISALLALGGVAGLVRPRLLDDYATTACYLHLRHELSVRFPKARVPALEQVLQNLFAVIPRPVDVYEARRVLTIAFGGHPPSSLMSLLVALGVPELLEVGNRTIDTVTAARAVHEACGTAFAEALLANGTLPPVVEHWIEERRSRFGTNAAFMPLRVFAGLVAEAGALLIYGAPSRPDRWERTTPVISHLSRLTRVLGLEGPPTLQPRRELLGLVVVDAQVASAYDQLLLDDAEALAEEVADTEDCSDELARRIATRRVMRGFRPFCGYLERVAELGAPITVLPRGLALDRRPTSRWQGIRTDLCPRPEVSVELLALAPSLLADEPDGHLVLVQLMSAARSSVVLALRPAYVFGVDEGFVIHVPWQANKTGTGLLFIPTPFAELFGFEASWFDPNAPADPPQWRRDELTSAIERLSRRFEKKTGHALPHRSIRFTRMALAQLYARHLNGLERETVTALLGHRRRETRANYLRALPEELNAAYINWRQY